MRGGDDFRYQALPFGGVEHPVADEIGERLLVEVLQLAAAATLSLSKGEVAARRIGAVGARLQRAVGQQQVAGPAFVASELARIVGKAYAAAL